MDQAGRYEFAPGPGGFALVKDGQTASTEQIQDFLRFCRAISWRSTKLDYPDAVCLATFESGGGRWICSIGEASRDEYGRGLALHVSGWLVELSEVRESLSSLCSENGVARPSGDAVGVKTLVWGATAHLNAPADFDLVLADGHLSTGSRGSSSAIADFRSGDQVRAPIVHDLGRSARSQWMLCGTLVGVVLASLLAYYLWIRPVAAELERKQNDMQALERELRESLLHDAVVTPEAVSYAINELRIESRVAQAAARKAEGECREWARAVGGELRGGASPERLRAKLREDNRLINDVHDVLEALLRNAGEGEGRRGSAEPVSTDQVRDLRREANLLLGRLKSEIEGMTPKGHEGR